MEAQLQRADHHHEVDPHNVGLNSGEGEGEHHHHGEKKSVLKKVKDKAKKIKDTIKKHSHVHDHNHDHEHRRRDIYQEGYEEESEDDDDEEVDNDPEVHGALMYESSVIRSRNIPQETSSNLENPTDSREDRYEHDVKDQGMSQPLAQGHRARALEAHAPENKMPAGPAPIDREKPNVGLEEDPHSPYNSQADISPSNYQSKVTDPTGAGGKEASVAPLVREFGNLNVHDAPVSGRELERRPDTAGPLNTGSNQVAKPDNSGQDSAATEDASVAEKISSDTDVVSNKAVSAKDMMVSKLGYGGDHQEGHNSSSPKKPISETASEYAHKVTETLAPVYEKVAGAGTAVMSKVQGSAEGANDGASMKEYLSEKFRPGDEDKALSEAITSALHKKKEAVGGKGEEKKVGKVTVSEEVAARLGPVAEHKREGEDAVAAGEESSGEGVVDRLKDAVGSWLGKSTGIQTAQESIGKSHVSGVGPGSNGGGTS